VKWLAWPEPNATPVDKFKLALESSAGLSEEHDPAPRLFRRTGRAVPPNCYTPPVFTPIPEILEELRRGNMVVLVDDENRENEGDLVLPAQFATAENVTFMLSKALGYLCLSLTEADCDRLNLHPQSGVNTSQRGTAFTVSIDLAPKFGGTTGVSAKERAACIRMAIDPKFGPDDFVRPGHINPLRARDGGVLVSSSAPDRPKAASTSAAWPASTPPLASSRS